jgi:hypothetical protein
MYTLLVDLYYIGAGRKGTGDWCFEDGFITFKDIAHLYLQYFRGQVLSIISDCSHSGSWIRECMAFLDEQGVKPCGHSAKNEDIFIKIFTSCLSHQVPRQLEHSVYACRNDKNTGLFTMGVCNNDVQNSFSENFTELKCGQPDTARECLCLPEATWQTWSTRRRIRKVRDRANNMWILLLLVDDDETVLQFSTADSIDYRDYGQILKMGHGEEPTAEDYKSILQQFALYRD